MIEIPLTKGYVAIIDDEDAHLAAFRWQASERRPGLVYAKRRTTEAESPGRPTIALHRAVLGLKRGDPIVDHRDGNGLNCRRANLKLGDYTMNARNVASSGRRGGATGLLGVSLHKATGRFRAYIRIGEKNKHLGLFDTADDANKARLAAERRVWGVQPRRSEAHGDQA